MSHQNGLNIAGIVFTFKGVAAIVIGLGWAVFNLIFWFQAERSEGRIVGFQTGTLTNRGRNTVISRPVIGFRDSGGTMHQVPLDIEFPSGIAAIDAITVRVMYYSDEPEDAKLEAPGALWLGPASALFVGSGLFAYGQYVNKRYWA